MTRLLTIRPSIRPSIARSPHQSIRASLCRIATLCPLLLLPLSLLPGLACATTLMRMSVAAMSQAAKAVARVHCLSNSTLWDSGEIWTLTVFEVQQVWRGVLPAEITVRLPGGRVSNITSTISGVPRFRPGEEAVLFLESSPRGGFSVVAWQQGTFRIHRLARSAEEIVTQDIAYYPVFDRRSGQWQPAGIAEMSLSRFRSAFEIGVSAAHGEAAQ